MSSTRTTRSILTRAVAGAAAVSAAAALAIALPNGSVGAQAVDPAGRWGPVESWPLIAIHAAMDADGDVLTYGTNRDGQQTGRFIYDVWSPNDRAANGHATLQNTTTTDLFCSLQLNCADTGEMMLFGGDNWNGSGTTNTGNPDINSFDPGSDRITARPGMKRPRWYATGTTLADGTMYIQGGSGGTDRPELWADGGSALLDLGTGSLDYWYPRNFLLSDGRIFGFDVGGQMYLVSRDLGTISMQARVSMPGNGNGTSAVMYRQDQILLFGGDTSDAWTIDLRSGSPVVNRTGSMATRNRTWVTAPCCPMAGCSPRVVPGSTPSARPRSPGSMSTTPLRSGIRRPGGGRSAHRRCGPGSTTRPRSCCRTVAS